MKVLSRRSTAVVEEGRRAEPSFDREAGAAVQVVHLRKVYPAAVAVDDVSFSVREGEIFGILGPNGAGKTIGDWTPSGAAVHAIEDAMLGTFRSAQLLAVLAGWALVFGFLAVRFFRWE